MELALAIACLTGICVLIIDDWIKTAKESALWQEGYDDARDGLRPSERSLFQSDREHGHYMTGYRTGRNLKVTDLLTLQAKERTDA
jgi:hypothetical protein